MLSLNFSLGSSTRSVDNNAPSDDSAIGAEIVMFATPLENMVLAVTPSNKLLVVRLVYFVH